MKSEEILNHLPEFVNLIREVLLEGKPPNKMCYIISSAINEILATFDIKTTLVMGEIYHTDWYHFWLELPDGRIIDATASQFTKPNGEHMPEVYIGKLPDWYITDGELCFE